MTATTRYRLPGNVVLRSHKLSIKAVYVPRVSRRATERHTWALWFPNDHKGPPPHRGRLNVLWHSPGVAMSKHCPSRWLMDAVTLAKSGQGVESPSKCTPSESVLVHGPLLKDDSGSERGHADAIRSWHRCCWWKDGTGKKQRVHIEQTNVRGQLEEELGTEE
ncbi:hypothetical protein EYF80_019573 [Liparis tanakae]|uniref:Uncharacterized protein n=1 Tax=Liparis tanakae TaxID=230148 RepID=A0A4Z2HZ27_9TELE|nr:hypothetical protein EYF80_019573 [Liparis tanakae]